MGFVTTIIYSSLHITQLTLWNKYNHIHVRTKFKYSTLDAVP